MRVRVFVRLGNPALVRHFVHATRHEPVAVNAEQGMMAFDVPYDQVENVLNRLAKTDICDFSAHVAKIPK